MMESSGSALSARCLKLVRLTSHRVRACGGALQWGGAWDESQACPNDRLRGPFQRSALARGYVHSPVRSSATAPAMKIQIASDLHLEMCPSREPELFDFYTVEGLDDLLVPRGTRFLGQIVSEFLTCFRPIGP